MPWVKDGVRYLPEGGRAFFERCGRELEARGRKTVVLSGSWDARFAAACAAVESTFRPPL